MNNLLWLKKGWVRRKIPYKNVPLQTISPLEFLPGACSGPVRDAEKLSLNVQLSKRHREGVRGKCSVSSRTHKGLISGVRRLQLIQHRSRLQLKQLNSKSENKKDGKAMKYSQTHYQEQCTCKGEVKETEPSKNGQSRSSWKRKGKNQFEEITILI